MSSIRLAILLVVFSVQFSCSQNAFVESAQKTSDAALLFEAKKLMNKSDWATAITKIQAMTTTGQALRETKTVLASAYAGKCGLNLVSLADKVSASTGSLFATLLYNLRTGTATSIADCQLAESTVLSIATAASSRTADENTFLAFVEFAKIGVVLSTYADTTDDGLVEASFDPCVTAQLPDAMLREIGTGVTIAVASLAATGGTIGSTLTSSVASTCTALAAINPAFDFCSITDPTAFSAAQVKAIGGMVRSSDSPGLGTCVGSIATCVCL